MKDKFTLTEEELCCLFGETAVPLIEVLRNCLYSKYREEAGTLLCDVFMGYEEGYELQLTLRKVDKNENQGI